MFGFQILEVAIGLAFVFLLLSLLASALREGVEGIMKTRAVHLERGIRSLLDDPEGPGLARHLYEHPLIAALYRGNFQVQSRRFVGRGLPTYVPSRSFALALLDLAVNGPATTPYAAQRTSPNLSVAELRQSVQRIANPFVQRALIVAIDNAGNDREKVQANLELWFNSAMEQVSGWYKRRTQLFLFVTGALTTLALNVNTIAIANYLWQNRDAREALVASAEQALGDSAVRAAVTDTSAVTVGAARARYAEIVRLDLPMGWDHLTPRPAVTASRSAVFSFWMTQVFGLLLTAFAITMGAPFWFDVLNKVVTVRSAVRPREMEKEKEEDEDGEKTAVPATPRARAAAPAVVESPVAAAAGGAVVVTTAKPSPVDAESSAPRNEWSSGDPDEGVL